jgi:hypothetical protein
MSKPLNPYDPTNYVETGLIHSKALDAQGEANFDKIFGPKKQTMFQAFREWASDNFNGTEYNEVMNAHMQSGEYPEDFLEDYQK